MLLLATSKPVLQSTAGGFAVQSLGEVEGSFSLRARQTRRVCISALSEGEWIKRIGIILPSPSHKSEVRTAFTVCSPAFFSRMGADTRIIERKEDFIMTNRNEKDTESLENLEARKVKMIGGISEIKTSLAKREKNLLKLEKRIQAKQQQEYLHNLKELGEIVINNFGKMFSQAESKEMLERIFALAEVKKLIAAEQKNPEELKSSENAAEDISETELNEVDTEKANPET